jgi:NDP-sugar pyrophosphorylase family protein
MKAMLFAAGLGTRLRPLTNDRPKALVEIKKDITLLHHNIAYLKTFGITTIVVNIHHFGIKVIEEIEKHHHFGVNILISDERDEVLETGGGLQKAAPLLTGKEDIVLFNVDVVSNIDLHQMLHFHQSTKALATLACRQRESSRYLLFDKHKLCGWQNTTTGEIKNPHHITTYTPLAFSGIHIIRPQFLSLLTQGGKYSITNTYLELMTQNHPILAYQHDKDYWFDVGKPDKLATAQQFLLNL